MSGVAPLGRRMFAFLNDKSHIRRCGWPKFLDKQLVQLSDFDALIVFCQKCAITVARRRRLLRSARGFAGILMPQGFQGQKSALPIVIGTAAMLMTSLHANGEAASTFDGSWTIDLECPQSPDGALAFTYQFPGTVQSSIFHGEHGVSGEPGWLQLDGQIQSDGSAAMTAKGLTGASAYSLNHARKGIPYQYPVIAKFDRNFGSGSWTTTRICTFRSSNMDRSRCV